MSLSVSDVIERNGGAVGYSMKTEGDTKLLGAREDHGGSSQSRVELGSEPAGFEEASGDVVGQVPEAER
jgi:hypothetical protein